MLIRINNKSNLLIKRKENFIDINNELKEKLK